MSIKKNKLSLRTETLRTLTSPELEAAAGGNQFPTATTTTTSAAGKPNSTASETSPICGS